MNKIKKVIFSFVFCFVIIFAFSVFIAGCQKKIPAGNNENNLAPLNNAGTGREKSNFTFVYITNPERVEHRTYAMYMPGDWKETEYNGGLVYIPPGGEFLNPFSEKFAFNVVFLAENETRSLKQLTDLDIEKSKAMFPDLKVIQEDETARLGQLDAIKVVFTGTVQNKTLQITQFRTMHGPVFYAFTQQGEYGQIKYSDIFNEMAQTFEWKNPE
jgi:hypothetical protein